MRSASSSDTSAIHPRTGENRKRMKQNMDLKMQKHAGTYEEASERSGVVCIWAGDWGGVYMVQGLIFCLVLDTIIFSSLSSF